MSNIQIVILLLIAVTHGVKSDCIWYGECGDANNGGKYNCKYDGPPKLLENDPELHELFRVTCPHLYEGNNTRTCCSREQIKRIDDNLSIPKQLMSRCPSCFTNFKSFLCDFTCNPDSSEFLLVTDEGEYNATQTQIKAITYHITDYYAQSMYDSCK